ncbi:MAG: hypothetical protein BMS9Abin07_1564 [Acidimicrobiia bacterium]|nr:MAG: hypothetical protein BMS9Abin07_1564 [Acidimicrobiia bacterium]
MFSLIGFLITGAVVGAIARFLVPGKDPMPWWGTVLLGAAAAIIGGWLAGFITPDNRGFPWITSLIAGVGLVLAVRFVRDRATS